MLQYLATSFVQPCDLVHQRCYFCYPSRVPDEELEKRLEKLRVAKGATPYGQGTKALAKKAANTPAPTTDEAGKALGALMPMPAPLPKAGESDVKHLYLLCRSVLVGAAIHVIHVQIVVLYILKADPWPSQIMHFLVLSDQTWC